MTNNHILLMKYRLNEELKKFRDGDWKVVMRESQQMLIREVFSEFNCNNLIFKERSQYLYFLVFHTLRQDGQMSKGRAGVDVNPHYIWTDKQDSASHTVIVGKTIFCTLIIDTIEDRDIGTYDLPG